MMLSIVFFFFFAFLLMSAAGVRLYVLLWNSIQSLHLVFTESARGARKPAEVEVHGLSDLINYDSVCRAAPGFTQC